MDIIERFLKRFRRQNPEASRQVERELRPMGREEEFTQPKMGALPRREEQHRLTSKKKRQR